MKIALCVPTLNAGDSWKKWLTALKSQSQKVDEVLIIDSSSDDDTVKLAAQCNYKCVQIKRSEFDHGGTRNYGLGLLSDSDIVIFLTQDAILADKNALKNLIKCFDDDAITVAFGRQLPHTGSPVIAAHARIYNYPSVSYVRTMEDRLKYGFKTVFMSNSFAAYRRKTLVDLGGFPSDVILSEDTFVAAKMILNGKKLTYCADARVYHSHSYTVWEEFKRYFDIGVFHQMESWILEKIGKPEGEGGKYVWSEIKYLFKHGAYYLLPEMFVRNGMKYLGYKLGKSYLNLPIYLIERLSMHRRWWRKH